MERSFYFKTTILFLGFSFNLWGQPIEPKENKKPIKSLFFKRELNLRHGLLKLKYAFNKSAKKSPSIDIIKKEWQLTFYDNFDSLDTKKWRLGQPWGEFHPGYKHQYYSKDLVQVKDGKLYLLGVNQPRTFIEQDLEVSIPYGVGLVNTDISFQQKYGYFEIKSINPKGPATWPAFWLTGANGWPPEIDIYEMYGRKTGETIHNQFATLHWGKTGTKSRGFLSQKINLPNNSDSVFHTYGCLWTPYFISFYTDGHLVSKIRVNKRLRKWMNDEMVIIINNSFDHRYTKYLPPDFKQNEFIIDYISVYSLPENEL